MTCHVKPKPRDRDPEPKMMVPRPQYGNKTITSSQPRVGWTRRLGQGGPCTGAFIWNPQSTLAPPHAKSFRVGNGTSTIKYPTEPNPNRT